MINNTKVIIASTKSWNIQNAINLTSKKNREIDVTIFSEKEELNTESVLKIDPDYIFFPHWSWIIPKEIYENYKCIVFHMTDLPFGRGGSPLQNLILQGIKDTKISAIEVDDEIDAGRIYMQKPLNLNGTADEIFMRASRIIFSEMIPFIIDNEIEPKKQQGEITYFKRRIAEESRITEDINSLERLYDFIRMLDGEGYPNAFIELGNFKFKFSRASIKNGRIVSDVTITEAEHE